MHRLPDWTVPRLRVRRSDNLIQHGRCSQVVLVTVDLPWPFSSREVVLDACGVDDIEYTGDIAVLVRALEPGDTSTVGFVCRGIYLGGGRESGVDCASVVVLSADVL